MYTTPETQKPVRNVDDADDELDDASSVQIILIIRIVHIIFFRISTQKALRATLLRGCFLVVSIFRHIVPNYPSLFLSVSMPNSLSSVHNYKLFIFSSS